MTWLTPLGGILIAALLLAQRLGSVDKTVAVIVLIVALVLFIGDCLRPYAVRHIPPA